MLLFCPECSNLLTTGKFPDDDPDPARQGKSRFECRTCSYEVPIEYHWYERRTMKKKEIEDIMGGAKAWENVDKTAIQFEARMSHRLYSTSAQPVGGIGGEID
ncbi:MAG: hypothetical protein Q9165_003188 [Trypethelium subeluteriae]